MIYSSKIKKSKFENIETNYLLLTEDYDEKSTQRIKKVQNILSLPEELYTLELLIRGNFELLNKRDISKQLELFNLKLIKSYPIKDIELLKEIGIIDEEYLNKSTKCGSNVYKKIKNKVLRHDIFN